MHVSNKQVLNSSIMAEIFFKKADLLQFFAFYVNNLTLWAR